MEICEIQDSFQNSFQNFLEFRLCIFLFLSFLSSLLSLFFAFSLPTPSPFLSFPSLFSNNCPVLLLLVRSPPSPFFTSLLSSPLLFFSFLLTPSSSSPHLPIDHSIEFIVFSFLPAFSHFPSHSHCSHRFC